jgi:hypothetical protein
MEKEKKKILLEKYKKINGFGNAQLTKSQSTKMVAHP